jgi:hypothetical protein
MHVATNIKAQRIAVIIGSFRPSVKYCNNGCDCRIARQGSTITESVRRGTRLGALMGALKRRSLKGISPIIRAFAVGRPAPLPTVSNGTYPLFSVPFSQSFHKIGLAAEEADRVVAGKDLVNHVGPPRAHIVKSSRGILPHSIIQER